MVKILLLQQWHTLSDPGAEEAVRDRLSFRRFCGLPLEVETPDHASIWRFRQTTDKLGLSAVLLAETNRQLDALSLIVKRGTLVDATLIAASVKRPAYGDNGLNPRDPDARVTMKRKKAYFGYKAHLAVEEGSGLVRQAEMTSANVHDFRLAEALIQGAGGAAGLGHGYRPRAALRGLSEPKFTPGRSSFRIRRRAPSTRASVGTRRRRTSGRSSGCTQRNGREIALVANPAKGGARRGPDRWLRNILNLMCR